MARQQKLRTFLVKKLRLSNKSVNELLIRKEVRLNGKTASGSDLVSTRDEVRIGKKLIQEKKQFVYIRIYKPRGVESTLNPAIPANLLTIFSYPKKLFPVGRLDLLSEGLMILTDDGDYCSRVISSANEVEKEYVVRVNKPVSADFLHAMRTGVVIMGQRTLPAKVVMQKGSDDTFHITLVEGRNRQIRRMCYKLGYEVESLKRIRIMDVELGTLRPGESREFIPAQ